MDRQEIMERIAEWFGMENDDYNINDYDWQAGCYLSGTHNDYGDMKFLNLAEVVYLIESIAEDYDWED